MLNKTVENGPTIWAINVIDGVTEIFIGNQFKKELSALDSLTNSGVSAVIGSLVASAVVGTYYKSAVYRYMYQKIKDFESTSIDILILVSSLTQHLMCLILVFTYTIGLGLNITISDYVDQAWCNVPWYAGIYGAAYRTFGSLGIAIYRVILIKRNDWVESFGRKKMLLVVLGLSIAISVGLTIGVGTGNGPASRKQVTWNWCKGENEEFREIIHEYSLITETVTPESELISKLCVLGALVGTFAELCCYLVFFGHLRSHDKGLFDRKVLQETEFKKRRQINSMTFLVQFYGFVVECITYVGVMFTLKKSSDIGYRLLISICFWVEFGIASVVEVMMSRNLKEFLPHNR